MGGTPSNARNSNSQRTPIKPILKSTVMPTPAYTYDYYSPQYMPEQYFYPAYPVRPENYPAVSSNEYLRSQYYPQTESKTTTFDQNTPTETHYGHHSHHHQHGHNTPYSHHHHHHHHHQRQSAIPIGKERGTSPLLPSVTVKRSTSVPANKEPLTAPQPVRHPSTILLQKPVTPIVYKEPKTSPPVQTPRSPSPAPITFTRISTPFSAAANSFQKAPSVQTNHVAKSPDNDSIHSYGANTISIVKRVPSNPTTSGNRWYDHEYDKRVKSLTATYV